MWQKAGPVEHYMQTDVARLFIIQLQTLYRMEINDIGTH